MRNLRRGAISTVFCLQTCRSGRRHSSSPLRACSKSGLSTGTTFRLRCDTTWRSTSKRNSGEYGAAGFKRTSNPTLVCSFDIDSVPNPQHEEYVRNLVDALIVEMENKATMINDAEFFLAKLKLAEAAKMFRQKYRSADFSNLLSVCLHFNALNIIYLSIVALKCTRFVQISLQPKPDEFVYIREAVSGNGNAIDSCSRWSG